MGLTFGSVSAGAMQALFGGAANAGSVPMQNQDSYSAKVDQWKELAEVYGVSLAAVALNFAGEFCII